MVLVEQRRGLDEHGALLHRVRLRPGALRLNLVWLLVTSLLAVSLIWLTGDFVQWIAYAFGIFAVAAWSQHLAGEFPS